jgi:glucokinase
MALGEWLADLALVHLPLGGIWLAGGVMAALADQLDPADLARGLHRDGPFADMLHAIPVRVLVQDDLALHGCARLGHHAPRA